MKQQNTNTLTILSMVLLGLSLLSFAIWGFLKFSRFGTSEQNDQDTSSFYSQPNSGRGTSEDTMPADNSLLIKARNKADSLEKLLRAKNAECDSLKQVEARLRQSAEENEISGEANRLLIRKLSELTERIQQLERENTRLSISLNKLESLRKKRITVPLNDDEPAPPAPSNSSPHRAILQVNIPQLRAIYTAGVYEKETDQADQTEMLKGTFTCENRTDESISGEIIMVLTDPAGNEVNINRESGYFDSEKGKIAYTCKFSLNLAGKETRDLPFRIRKDGFMRGAYKMELYFEGRLVSGTEIELN